jgi:hypothetical protein
MSWFGLISDSFSRFEVSDLLVAFSSEEEGPTSYIYEFAFLDVIRRGIVLSPISFYEITSIFPFRLI